MSDINAVEKGGRTLDDPQGDADVDPEEFDDETRMGNRIIASGEGSKAVLKCRSMMEELDGMDEQVKERQLERNAKIPRKRLGGRIKETEDLSDKGKSIGIAKPLAKAGSKKPKRTI
ncbi:hypothetical protein BGX31_009876 [Mortierella sp. GBA43]|nr:hypothetical protein BGX31_009876 [Mortierella sp. GBA43]